MTTCVSLSMFAMHGVDLFVFARLLLILYRYSMQMFGFRHFLWFSISGVSSLCHNKGFLSIAKLLIFTISYGLRIILYVHRAKWAIIKYYGYRGPTPSCCFF